MSWRLVAVLFIALFAILTVSATTADPIRQVTDSIENIDGADEDVAEQADSGIRAYGNLILILVFGLIAWASWRLIRRELTEGRL